MAASSPVGDSIWNPPSSSSPSAPKRKRASTLLSGLTSKFSRKKSSPTTGITKEDLWKVAPNVVHPNAAKLGMTAFNFPTGGSREGTIVEQEIERERSPGAVSNGRVSRDASPTHVSDKGSLGPGKEIYRKSSGEEDNKDTDVDEDEDVERIRGRSRVSAYSDTARKRASGYVARTSSAASLEAILLETEKFANAYPRQIQVKGSRSQHGSDYSDLSMLSPVSSMSSFVQRNGSSLFDRRLSRYDSIDTNVTTPEKTGRPTKPSLRIQPPQSLPESFPEEEELYPSMIENVRGEWFLSDGEIPPLALADDEEDGASVDTTEEIRPMTPREELSSEVLIQSNDTTSKPRQIPLVMSYLQGHQIRTQDFSMGTHIVRNSMEMAADGHESYPRKAYKSMFIEHESEEDVTLASCKNEEAIMNDENDEVGETLRSLSLTAVNGNTEYYSQGAARPRGSTAAPSPGLTSVMEESTGPWYFGHKRSTVDADPSESLDEHFGSLPLHERAGERRQGEGVGFKPGHRRSRAVSLGRPKTIVVLPRTVSVMSGSYEDEDVELDEAVAKYCAPRDRLSTSDVLDLEQQFEDEVPRIEA